MSNPYWREALTWHFPQNAVSAPLPSRPRRRPCQMTASRLSRGNRIRRCLSSIRGGLLDVPVLIEVQASLQVLFPTRAEGPDQASQR
jgi:hypothetical protein